ncbi:hypothetical protein [Latilactobacillus sakei]|uniref:hypothetical protein n=1 Tax=Latilactobacillus sakei TaxID=1599 RepID=UPI003F52C03A
MKKENMIRNFMIFLGIVIVIPGVLAWIIPLVNISWLAGDNSDWISFWGGYLGSILAVLYAFYTSKKQAEKAKFEVEERIEETRKAELRAYHEKGKLDKIFEIQEELSEMFFTINQFLEKYEKESFIDASKIRSDIQLIRLAANKSDKNILKLQFYINRDTPEFEKYKNKVLETLDNKKITFFDNLLNIPDFNDTNYFYLNLNLELNKYKENHIEQQIRNINELLEFSRNSIK